MKQPVTTPARNRNNNFDLLRLVAALMVLFSHSFGETLQGSKDILYQFSGHRHPMSWFGLIIFFTISGYLVTESILVSASVKQYIWKRVLRIYPGYIVLTILIVFILGPVFTILPIRDYFSSMLTWRYFSNNVLLLINQKALPGVFDGRRLNESAWTLPIELKLYAMILLLYLLKFFQYRWLQAITFFCFIGTILFIPLSFLQQWLPFNFGAWYNLGFFFIAGSTMYVWRDKIRLHYTGVVLLALVWWIGSLFSGLGHIPEFVFFVYSILYAGFKTPVFPKLKADISYGLYIYGSPVQETVSWITGASLPLWKYNLVIVPVSLLLAFLSWWLVEKKALMLKDKFI